MNIDNDPNPAPELEAEQPEAEEEVETASDETVDADVEEPEEGQPDDDSEEVQIEGKAYRVPKAVRPHLLMQADYTRKTQEVSESRKDLERRQTDLENRSKAFEETTKARDQNFREVARIVSMDEQLAEFARINWDELDQRDPVEHGRKFRQYTLLTQQRSALANQVAVRHQELNQQAQRDTAKRFGEFVQSLPREIPDWSPEVNAEVSGVFERLGFSRDEITKLADIRLIKLARLASKGAKVEQQQRQLTTKPKPAEARPVSQVGARTPPVNRLTDKAPTNDWIAARNKQVMGKR